MFSKTRAIFLFLSLVAPGLGHAASPPAAELVCKKDGLSFSEDEACQDKEGIVVNTSFGSKNYDECLYRAELADKIPALFTPWQPPSGGASGAEASARQRYCRGLWPDLTSNGHTAAWSGEEMFSKIAISLESVELCKSRLTAADALPVYSRLWTDGIDEFCGERVKPLNNSGGSGSGKYRSRWDQVGGAWSTGWVPGHEEAVCVNGLNCNCGTNACGNFKSGETTFVWPSGCAGPKWTIKCTSEAEEGGSGWGVADPIAGEGTWRRVEYVPAGGDTLTCRKDPLPPMVGGRCQKKGLYCTKLNGNALPGAMSIESFLCE